MSKEEGKFFKEMARKDLISYCVYTDKFFEVNFHHEIIWEKLQAFMEWKIKKLILQTPPRSGKSREVQESISWTFGKESNLEVIYTWHSVWLLEWFSRSIRDKINWFEWKSLFTNKIKEDNGWVSDWSMDNGNRLMIYWVWWGITGKWGHRLIIDDPYATRQDAESDTIRKKVEDWYDSTFLSRRHNENAGICIIMQRWREDDLVWYILSKEDDWEVVSIPAISEDGKSFWASRFSVAYLENMRKNIGDYFFQSQYQQKPFSDWSGTFKTSYFNYYTEAPVFSKIYTFVDPAISLRQEADYSAIVTVGVTKYNDIYILDVFRERVEPDELISNILRIGEEFKPNTIGIETVQFQKMLALEIKKQMRMQWKFFHIYEMKPTGEKESRIKATLQPRYSSWVVYHKGDWNNIKELELELIKFPNGKHDDMIDALASCVAMANIENKQTSLTGVQKRSELDDIIFELDIPEDDNNIDSSAY